MNRSDIYEFVKKCAVEGISLKEGCEKYRSGYKRNQYIIIRWFKRRYGVDPRVVRIGGRWGYRYGKRIVMWNKVVPAEKTAGEN